MPTLKFAVPDQSSHRVGRGSLRPRPSSHSLDLCAYEFQTLLKWERGAGRIPRGKRGRADTDTYSIALSSFSLPEIFLYH